MIISPRAVIAFFSMVVLYLIIGGFHPFSGPVRRLLQEYIPASPTLVGQSSHRALSALVLPGAGAEGGWICQVLPDLLFQCPQQMSVLIAPGRSFL